MTGCIATARTVGPSGGGGLARAGRAKLRTDLTHPATAAEPAGCYCARCCPEPLTDIEAQRALRHVSNQDAVAYARGDVTVVRLRGCDECGGWVPTFTEVA
ncbi:MULTISPECIES: hypothetical protein [Mycolicibacterium]|uniref:Uncharacterized protein n=3 Tax=Mycobacteriaceae TaxID=1762 RepID=A0AAD1IRA8_MYCMB|nr:MULTISPECIES: hypothetical protein [Mycolicibacterium]MDA4102831.1 hypothetical protein [Mycolicibacterium monacense DSM 44395]ORB14535.1 hypothetical protein BST34_22970 [Mycolicibacterium monacense DSM 44395]ORB65722.1 hypothetical protein BST47_12335 [Mycolicibacterium tusciae]QHP87452.1 hypothetical protein EWR22_19985 [Mycolicibacterium monacense DSM 44395]BBZ59419.1 hypothetical protein MMON_07200 [Mycolicibacterium monacense]